MDNLTNTLKDTINNTLISCVLSGKKNKLGHIDKIKIRPIIIKQNYVLQITEYSGQKVLHQNQDFEYTIEYIRENILNNFKQCQIQTENSSISILSNKKGNITIKGRPVTASIDKSKLQHNRKKKYLLEEGSKIPFLVDLGVMNNEGYIIKSKYDKYRQINRFLEFINDVIPKLDSKKRITILDFGCGKSYLTFAMYYFLKEIKGLDIHIIGLDLKEDVITHCNSLKERYGYNDLEFLIGDVANYKGVSHVDMVVTLHACDTATDYALARAIQWNADVILSVPCCQHEVNSQIKNDLLSPILKHGLLKERISALLTDGIRAEILELYGYDTQILEFIDIEHTPKNILIRGVRSSDKKSSSTKELDNILKEFNISQTLNNLLNEE